MEIKFIGSGLGASVPNLKFGFSLMSGVYIQFRDTPQSSPVTFGIATSAEVGGNNGTFIASFVATDWAKVDVEKHSWLSSKRNLIGRTAEVEFKGTLLFGGKVDISFSIFDDFGEKSFSLEKINVEASGGQLSDTKVRGAVVDMMGQQHSARKN